MKAGPHYVRASYYRTLSGAKKAMKRYDDMEERLQRLRALRLAYRRKEPVDYTTVPNPTREEVAFVHGRGSDFDNPIVHKRTI